MLLAQSYELFWSRYERQEDLRFSPLLALEPLDGGGRDFAADEAPTQLSSFQKAVEEVINLFWRLVLSQVEDIPDIPARPQAMISDPRRFLTAAGSVET